jgi:predicted TIM-barrel fold metal-dependent hydrolase
MDELARRYPETRFVVDHLGLTQPLSPPAPDDALADLPHVLALARYPNVAIKLTGVGTYSRRPFPYDDLWEPIGRVVDEFGVDRCMWGTDWTRALDVLTYEEGVASFRDHWPLSSSDRDALMGGTAWRVYDWTRWPS